MTYDMRIIPSYKNVRKDGVTKKEFDYGKYIGQVTGAPYESRWTGNRFENGTQFLDLAGSMKSTATPKAAINGKAAWMDTKAPPPGVEPVKPSVQASGKKSGIQAKQPLRIQTRPELGAQKSGWGKPVPLLGLTKDQATKMKSQIKSRGVTKNTVKDMTAFRNRTVNSAAIPGRFFSDQAAWIAAAAAQQELQQFRLNPQDPAWGAVDQIGSIVSTGLSYINPILGALGGPMVEGIAQIATQAAKNNVFEGGMNLGSNEYVADFKRYAKFLEDNPDIVGITFDEWKKYDDQLQAYNGAGSQCQKLKITPEMLGDQTLEEYMAENGIDPSGPAPEKPKSKGSNRPPTKEEEEALKNARLG